jgi:hypothetical protein
MKFSSIEITAAVYFPLTILVEFQRIFFENLIKFPGQAYATVRRTDLWPLAVLAIPINNLLVADPQERVCPILI